MPMPKGHRVSGGYFTVAKLPNAEDFNQIAVKCADAGFPMGSSTARKILLGAMMKVARELRNSQQATSTNLELYEIVRTPAFQAGLADMLNER